MGMFDTTRREQMSDLMPVTTAEMPLPDYDYDSELPGSRDVNIILMVQEHAPKRVSVIEKQIEQMENEMARLLTEKDTLQKLIKVANNE